jgi:hypothetical protein
MPALTRGIRGALYEDGFRIKRRICISTKIGLFRLPLIAIFVGVAGKVGGATGAAMTAVTMIFEMTRDY